MELSKANSQAIAQMMEREPIGPKTHLFLACSVLVENPLKIGMAYA